MGYFSDLVDAPATQDQPSLFSPFEAAADRVRQAQMPVGGRRESLPQPIRDFNGQPISDRAPDDYLNDLKDPETRAQLVEKIAPLALSFSPGSPIPPRAKAEGFDTLVYHATNSDFGEFKPSTYRGATFFAPTPNGAVRGAAGAAAEGPETATQVMGPDRVIPAYLRSGEIYGLHLTPAEKSWWQDLPARTDEAGIDAAMKNSPGNLDYWWKVFDERPRPGGGFEYVKREMPSLTLKQANDTGRDVYGEMIGGYNAGGLEDRTSAARIRDLGMRGFIVSDEGGVSVAHAAPSPESVRFAIPEWK